MTMEENSREYSPNQMITVVIDLAFQEVYELTKFTALLAKHKIQIDSLSPAPGHQNPCFEMTGRYKDFRRCFKAWFDEQGIDFDPEADLNDYILPDVKSV